MRRFFHLIVKLIANYSEGDKAFGSIHESIMTKIKRFLSKDWIVKTIVEYGIKIFKC